MDKPIVFGLGLVLAGLAAAGFIKNKQIREEKKNKRFLGLMNVDTSHSLLRTPLATTLLMGKKASPETRRRILTGTGILYLAIGILGLKDRKLNGLLPSKLTNFDLVYHFTTGIASLVMGMRKAGTRKLMASE